MIRADFRLPRRVWRYVLSPQRLKRRRRYLADGYAGINDGSSAYQTLFPIVTGFT